MFAFYLLLVRLLLCIRFLGSGNYCAEKVFISIFVACYLCPDTWNGQDKIKDNSSQKSMC